MKIILIAALASCIVVKSVQKQQSQAPAPENQQSDQRNGNASTPATNQQESITNYSLPKDKATDWHDSIAPQTWPNWLLVLVGIATAAAIVCQTIQTRKAAEAASASVAEIKRQADIMEQQVEAASANAVAAKSAAQTADKNLDMFMSKERARVMIKPSPLETLKPDVQQFVGWTIFSLGATPALEVRGKAEAIINDSEEPIHKMEYGFKMHMPDVFVPPEKHTGLCFIIPEMKLTNADMDNILGGERFLHFLGVINYKTVFDGEGEERETKFCFVWDRGSMQKLIGGTAIVNQGSWKENGTPDDNNKT